MSDGCRRARPGPERGLNWPRLPDGSLDPERMPTGVHIQITGDGERVPVDLTPRHTDGTPIVP